MGLREVSSMPKTSKIIVDREELIPVLKAAAKVAENKPPHDVVQIRFDQDTEAVQVCAVNGKATFVAYLEPEMADVLERDQIFEIEKSRIAGITAMRFPKAGEEIPRVGLIIAESWLEITDESGLGLGVHKLRLPRSQEVALEGKPARTIERAAAMAEIEIPKPFPEQLRLLTAVASAAGGRPSLRPVASPPGAEADPHRIIASTASWAMTISAHATAANEDSDSGGDRPMAVDAGSYAIGFDDIYEDDDQDDEDEPHEQAGPRIVEATPPDGAA